MRSSVKYPSESIDMDKRFGIFILVGLLIGTFLGSAIGSANQNAILGTGLGALVGVFLGWFIAAAAVQRENDKKAGK